MLEVLEQGVNNLLCTLLLPTQTHTYFTWYFNYMTWSVMYENNNKMHLTLSNSSAFLH